MSVLFPISPLRPGVDRVYVVAEPRGDIPVLNVLGKNQQFIRTTQIPADAPIQGTIRLRTGETSQAMLGFPVWKTVEYINRSDDTFYIRPTDFVRGTTLYVTYLDKLAENVIEYAEFYKHIPGRIILCRIRGGISFNLPHRSEDNHVIMGKNSGLYLSPPTEL